MDCANCEYAKPGSGIVTVGTIRKRTFFCKHPNQKSILNSFKNRGYVGQVGYIGRGSLYASKPDTKGHPKWCPYDKGGNENG